MPAPSLPLKLADFPQLRLIAWNRRDDDCVAEDVAFALYEANWQHVDAARLSAAESALIERLKHSIGQGVMLV
jgi:hypothetical protein